MHSGFVFFVARLAFLFSTFAVVGCRPAGADFENSENEAVAEDSVRSRYRTRLRYRDGVLHSPYTAALVEQLQQVMARAPEARPQVFAKLGDSITASPNFFLGCFSGNQVRWGAYEGLEGARDFFSSVSLSDGATSFERVSLGAGVGWTARRALQGTPSPVERELAALQPAFAVVMFGTNETGYGAGFAFERNLLAVVDALLERGVVPLLSTIPPRANRGMENAVTEMNAVVRLVAQRRQVPLMDYHSTMVGLRAMGLAPDGVHPVPYSDGYYQPCDFTEPGLSGGVNQRNLLVLQALDRAKRFLVDRQSPETLPAGNALVGSGTRARPYAVDDRVFVDMRSMVGARASTAPDACNTRSDVSGPERVYRLSLANRTWVRARLYADDAAGFQLSWLNAQTGACTAWGKNTVDFTANAGEHLLVVQSPSGSAAEYGLTLALGR